MTPQEMLASMNNINSEPSCIVIARTTKGFSSYKDFNLLTSKPVQYIYNVAENNIAIENGHTPQAVKKI